jgi:hypothetical protein
LLRRRDEDLFGQNITLEVNGNTLNPALVDTDLTFPNGKSPRFTRRRIAQRAGGLSNLVVSINVTTNQIYVAQTNTQLDTPNRLALEPRRKPIIYSTLKVNGNRYKPLVCLALQIRQLKATEALGLKSVDLSAARTKNYPTGYSVWPKIGFDAKIPEEVVPELIDFLRSYLQTGKAVGLSSPSIPANLKLSSVSYNLDGSPNKEMQAW